MRFETSRVLDAIERRLCVDPMVARAVVDLAEVVRYQDLDGGRVASLLRLGQVVDALGRLAGEESVSVYTVVDRGLLSDNELTSNERMVVRRWADDGLLEVLAPAGDRILEVADLTGLAVLTRRDPRPLSRGYPWLLGDPGRLLVPRAENGGAVLVGSGGMASPASFTHPVLARLWRCPQSGCELFGPDRTGGQPPPRLWAGVPSCPRHEHRLADGGPRPAAIAFAVRVGGVVRERFTLVAGSPVTVGREPSEPGGVRLGPWLGEDALRMVSRSHLTLTLTHAGVEVVDMSTNGTLVRGLSTPDTRLARGDRRPLAERDVVELYEGVELARADRWRSGGRAEPRSVMAEAPTVALRLPRQ